MEATPAPGPIKASQVDENYARICSQLGETFLKRSDLLDQLRRINVEIETLKLRREQAVAQYQALRHNESLDEVVA